MVKNSWIRIRKKINADPQSCPSSTTRSNLIVVAFSRLLIMLPFKKLITYISQPLFRVRVFFPGPGSDFSSSPDLPKIRIRSGKIWSRSRRKCRRKCYIFHIKHCFFGQAPLKPQPFGISKPSFRSHKVIIGRIRTYKIRIRIGEKTRIHPDPDTKHCIIHNLRDYNLRDYVF